MLYPIVQTGDPVLRELSKAVEPNDFKEKWFQDLVEDMRETMRDAPGVGLAAPQIDKSLQLFVVEDDSEYLDDMDEEDLIKLERTRVPFYVVVNPTLTILNEEVVTHFEGCLSVDGFRAEVTRAHDVQVDGLNEKGEEISVFATGWHARIVQHEFDHLQGTLYIDRMNSLTFASTEEEDDEDVEEDTFEG